MIDTLSLLYLKKGTGNKSKTCTKSGNDDTSMVTPFALGTYSGHTLWLCHRVVDNVYKCKVFFLSSL